MTQSQKIAMGVVLFFAIEFFLIAFVDKPVSLYLRTVDLEHTYIIDFFRAFTDFGKSNLYFIISGGGILICAAFMRLRHLPRNVRARAKLMGQGFLFLLAAIAASGLITDILKPLIGRARPVVMDREGLYTFRPLTFEAQWNSMPSGHATTSITLTCVLIALFPRYRWLWIVLGTLLLLSRIIVNAHYISDTIAGAAIACLSVWVLGRAFNHNGMFHVNHSIFPIDKK